MKNWIIAVGGLLVGATCLMLAGCDKSSPLSESGATSQISVQPASAPLGGADLQLTIRRISGPVFVNGEHERSEAIWVVSGTETRLATTFVSSTELTAIIPAALMKSPANAGVFVQTQDPSGGRQLPTSNIVFFRVSASARGKLSVTSISPTSAPAGSPNLTLTVTGSNFVNDGSRGHSRVDWRTIDKGDTLLPTTIVSGTEASAVVPSGLLAEPTHATISVQNWYDLDCGPSAESNSVDFDVK